MTRARAADFQWPTLSRRYRPGEHVRSWYAAPWYGVVLDVEPTGRGDIVVALVTHDRHGRPVDRRIVHRYGHTWFEPCDRPLLGESVHLLNE